MEIETYRNFLTDLQFFKGFERREMDVLMGVLRMQEFNTGEVIFRQGAFGNACYIIAQGSIRVTLGSPPKEQELAVLPKGALFGQVALIDHERRSASCTAAEPSVVLVLERNEFDLLFRSGSTFAFKFLDVVIRILVGQLRSANTRLVEAAEQEQAKAAPAAVSDPKVQSLFKDVAVKTDSFRVDDFDLDEVQVLYSESDRARGASGPGAG